MLPTLLSDLQFGALPPVIPDRFQGTLLIQPMAASWSSAYAPFVGSKPEQVAGHGTILVFTGGFNFSQLAALRRLNRGMLLFFMHDSHGAIQEFAAAEANCPETDRVRLHSLYGAALQQEGRLSEAKAHALTVLKLTEGDPSYRFERQTVLDAVPRK